MAATEWTESLAQATVYAVRRAQRLLTAAGGLAHERPELLLPEELGSMAALAINAHSVLTELLEKLAAEQPAQDVAGPSVN